MCVSSVCVIVSESEGTRVTELEIECESKCVSRFSARNLYPLCLDLLLVKHIFLVR